MHRLLITILIAFHIFTTGALASAARKAPTAVAIARWFGPVGQTANAECVAFHESSDDPTKSNGTQVGLFEIAKYVWDPQYNPKARAIVGNIDWSKMKNANYNAMVASRIWKHSGWLPAWTAEEYDCDLG